MLEYCSDEILHNARLSVLAKRHKRNNTTAFAISLECYQMEKQTKQEAHQRLGTALAGKRQKADHTVPNTFQKAKVDVVKWLSSWLSRPVSVCTVAKFRTLASRANVHKRAMPAP